MSTNRRVRFTTEITAPVSVVFQTMLDPESYQEWASAFAEGSRYDGSWQRGEKIKFVGPSGDGMVAEVAEHRLNEFTSIRHIGFIINGVEDTQSDAIRAWAPAYENYTFIASTEGTRVTVDQDVTEEWEADISQAWPKALQRLKLLCEARPAV